MAEKSHAVYIEVVATFIMAETGFEPELHWNEKVGMVCWLFPGDQSAAEKAWRRAQCVEDAFYEECDENRK